MSQDKFDTVVALCEAMAWATEPQAVYQRIVDVLAVYFECDQVHLHLLDFDGKTFLRRASHGAESALEESSGPRFSVNVGRSPGLLSSGNIILMKDYDDPDPADVIPAGASLMGYKSAMSLPIISPQGVLGMVSLVYKRKLPWSEDDFGYLTDIGRVLGVMVHRIQMTKKDLELEILRERKRLSVEIHDNLSQMVSSLAMRSDTALMSYEEGDHARVQVELEQLGEVSRGITKVLREEMLSLRTPVEERHDFVEGARDMLDRFERQWGIRTSFEVTDAGLVVSGHTALQLLRILNECLSNVLRHAHAQSVCVTLRDRGRKIELIVRDDGKGFNVAAVSSERLGIRIMQERALAARGALRIESGEGGTAVIVEVKRG